MAVKYDNSGIKYIKWTAPSGVVGLISKTIHLKYTHRGDPSSFGTLWTIFDGTGSDTDQYDVVLIPAGGFPLKIAFAAHHSTTDGYWRTTNDVLALDTETDIIVTYDGSNTANNPAIYIHGISVPVTRVTAPVGTYRSGVSTDMYIGTPLSGGNPNGEIEDVRVYTGLKSAAQAAVIAGEDIETDATIDETNIVFHAPLTMCKGLTYETFAGSTLGAANTFFDRIAGLLGVPSGSPLGA
jgi:hypothetical protein